jgi:AcrR family transcriptional regulator
MSPRPDVSEQRRNQIIDAATKVFTRLGFQNARMDDIAEEARLSKGSLYWYFESKDEIILNILDNLFDNELSELNGLSDMEGSAVERLLQFSNQTITAIKDMQPLMPILLDFYALTLRRGQIQQVFAKYLRRYLLTLTPIIQHGIDQGEFHQIDPQEAAIAIGANFEGTILMWAYDPETVDMARHMRAGIQLLIAGLSAHR